MKKIFALGAVFAALTLVCLTGCKNAAATGGKLKGIWEYDDNATAMASSGLYFDSNISGSAWGVAYTTVTGWITSEGASTEFSYDVDTGKMTYGGATYDCKIDGKKMTWSNNGVEMKTFTKKRDKKPKQL